MTDPRSRFYPILLSRESWDWGAAADRAVVLFAFSTRVVTKSVNKVRVLAVVL